MTWISISVLYYALFKSIYFDRTNDVKFISVDRQKLDLAKLYLLMGTIISIFVEVQPDSTNIKNYPCSLFYCY